MDNQRKKALLQCRDVHKKNNWSIDYDYLEKLSTQDLVFLAAFTHFYYRGCPHRCNGQIPIDDKMKKESYRRDYIAKKDILNQNVIEFTQDITQIADTKSEDYLIELIDISASIKV